MSRQVYRHFTKPGYGTKAVPRDVWAEVTTYHHNNRHALVPEDWNP